METEDGGNFSWARLEFAAVSAVAVMFGCLFVGQTAEHYIDGAPAPQTASVQAKPVFNAIDYATTGAAKTGTVVIGPCDTGPR